MERSIHVLISGLPLDVTRKQADRLIGRLARLMAYDAEIGSYLEECHLEPSPRAATLAAAAAVTVLFAHEAGQEIAAYQMRDMLAAEAEEEAPHAHAD
jgi:hypothetical protein